VTATTYQVNLLDTGDLYGEGYFIVDLKLAKNVRFAGRRVNFGVDVYNLFNSDAIRAYEPTYPGDGGGCRMGLADDAAESEVRAAPDPVRLLIR
jgi:hypothetical protein